MDDPRLLSNGCVIPSEGYCDQPYVVRAADGAWVCVMTTGRGREGEPGQHIVALRSTDAGRTWSAPVAIEPADGPEASWALPLAVPSGRLYVFYTYNAENRREAPADPDAFPGGVTRRVDTLGEFALKFSDDGGRSWSDRRWFIPVRPFAIDRRNPLGGAVRFFWGVGKPVTHGGSVYLGFTKVGRFGRGFMAESEGCFLHSPNLLAERDPARLVWETLPEGEVGLRSPGGGPVCEEANLAALSDGTLFATCRTVEGHPVQAYSRDGGRTWDAGFMRTAPGGALVHHPRAANFVRRLAAGRHAGRFLFWFHNNSARGYDRGSRNPAWLMGGVERDAPEGKVLHWGRPEVVLYDLALDTGISYPDFIEDNGRLWITETQKTIARVHAVPDRLLDRMFEDP